MSGTYEELVIEEPASGDGIPTGRSTWRWVVQCAIPNDAYGRFDVDTFGHANFSDGWEWYDLSSRWRGSEWTRGREGLLDHPDTGEAHLTLANNDGALSRWNADSTFPAPSYLGPDLLVRFGWWRPGDTTWRPAFVGLVDTATDVASEADADLWQAWDLFETTGVLSLIDGSEQVAQGSGDTVDARQERILDEAAWPYGLGDNLHGFYSPFETETLEATTLAGNRLAEVLLTSDSGFQDAFSDRYGRLDAWAKGYSEPWLLDDGTTRVGFSESIATATVAGSLVHYLPWAAPIAIIDSKVGMYNRVTVARAGGTSVGAEDSASVGLNGVSTYRRTDLLLDADDALTQWAEYFLLFFADATLGMSDLELNIDQDPEGFGALTRLDFGRSIYVARRNPRQATGFADTRFACVVTGYTASVVPVAGSQIHGTASVQVAVLSYVEE